MNSNAGRIAKKLARRKRRNDEAFLNAIGADSIPDPTTAGDFCRRFSSEQVRQLLDAINRARLIVWKRQPQEFFDEAFVDMDGTRRVRNFCSMRSATSSTSPTIATRRRPRSSSVAMTVAIKRT